ncbi:cobalt-precorrin-6A reductase [Pseudochelatococcus lubricantis]|uniref:cobalt-precorrin-6A reductase n=1 Tax=Pseudochelatococcus lubricantis TaxID=1538102 RepID=UPI0035EA7AF6
MMTADHRKQVPILILGGTGEARQLAQQLNTWPALAVTLSLAGRTAQPQLPQGGRLHVRTGGFGGVEGLSDHLRRQGVRVLIDATHPFAARMSAHAILAARLADVPLLAIDRPAWPRESGDRWIEVPDMAGAAAALGEAPQTVFLAIGRQEVAPFRRAPQHRYIVRSIEPVAQDALPPGATAVLARGPFAEADERRLFEMHGVTVIVAKNSGGAATYGKIAAARGLDLPVVMVQRPSVDAAGHAPDMTVPDADAALSALRVLLPHLSAPDDRGE